MLKNLSGFKYSKLFDFRALKIKQIKTFQYFSIFLKDYKFTTFKIELTKIEILRIRQLSTSNLLVFNGSIKN